MDLGFFIDFRLLETLQLLLPIKLITIEDGDSFWSRSFSRFTNLTAPLSPHTAHDGDLTSYPKVSMLPSVSKKGTTTLLTELKMKGFGQILTDRRKSRTGDMTSINSVLSFFFFNKVENINNIPIGGFLVPSRR